MSYLTVDSYPFTSAGRLAQLIGKDLKSKKGSGWVAPIQLCHCHTSGQILSSSHFYTLQCSVLTEAR